MTEKMNLRVRQGEQYNTYMEVEPPKALIEQMAAFFGVGENEAREFLIHERSKIKSKLEAKPAFGQNQQHEA